VKTANGSPEESVSVRSRTDSRGRQDVDATNVPTAAAVNFLADPTSSWIAPSLSPAISMVNVGGGRRAGASSSASVQSACLIVVPAAPRVRVRGGELPRHGVTSMMSNLLRFR
jgi:hypothetical protein